MKPFVAPLFDALLRHTRTAEIGFHVPGHRGGEALNQPEWSDQAYLEANTYFQTVMRIDVTELSSTDDLHHPEASIMEAQRLAARTFGSEDTYFLVGGSTSGNIALLLTICEPNDLIIVQRNVHKSVLNGLRLAGARAVFLSPQVEVQSGLATIPSVQQVEEALVKYPEAKAVFLSNPNYYGMNVRLTPYVELVHQYNLPILIDEAHGAHYSMHGELPPSAVSEGADAVVQSAHKTLPTLTMGAMLHVQGERISRQQLSESLAMIQSSSPSFPIMASIDISRAMIDALGAKLFQQSLDSANIFRAWLDKQSTGICEMKAESSEWHDLCNDPLRVVLYDKRGKLTGYELQQQLESRGCYVEMADPRYVVLVLGIQASLADIQKLQYTLEQISVMTEERLSFINDDQELSVKKFEQMILSEPVSFARGRFKYEASKRIPLHESEHHVSAELVVPYPPGIAILYPGETITAAAISRIKELASVGAKFQGSLDGQMATISVYLQ
ncbi:aminotransferase class I/II-fold pyridoxal phosphate-dependent enzyme [Paenibacillus sinopodophylli]|uniref:aminotransferase class I/II-fold pyridoxal phosphate-dependent enzyme n=1 Tax=Paenibacillus sinopodophylli TaxID=1837342 RepID=UPI00110D1EA4|nr:aminotransferase class I/II-fold pyridoxal phosphate-dependent enzyme [Paenibacillus sinopodophylli]